MNIREKRNQMFIKIRKKQYTSYFRKSRQKNLNLNIIKLSNPDLLKSLTYYRGNFFAKNE